MAEAKWKTEGWLMRYIADARSQRTPILTLAAFINKHTGNDLRAEFIDSGVLDAVWAYQDIEFVRSFMQYVKNGALWLHGVPFMRPQRLPTDAHRYFLFTTPHRKSVFYALARISTNYGQLLLLNIPTRRGGFMQELGTGGVTPLQYAITLPDITPDIIQCLLNAGADIFDLTRVHDIPSPEIAMRVMNEIVKEVCLDHNEASFDRLPPSYLIRIMESSEPLARALLTSTHDHLRDFMNRPITEAVTLLSLPWLTRYLEYKCRRADAEFPDWIPLASISSMRTLWLHAPAENTLAFLVRCMQTIPHAHQLLTLALKCPPSQRFPPHVVSALLQYNGYPDGATQILHTLQVMRRPERLLWLLPYCNDAPYY